MKKKIIFILVGLIVIVHSSNSQSCHECPTCDTEQYDYCYAGYDDLMAMAGATASIAQMNAASNANDCLAENYSDYTYGDLTGRLEGTECQDPYDSAVDTSWSNWADEVTDYTSSFHDCMGVAGCGDSW